MGSKKRRVTGTSRPRKSASSLTGLLYVIIPVVVVVIIGVVVIGLRNGSSGNVDNLMYPSYAASMSTSVKVAYNYAVVESQELQYIPCFCGCGIHSGHTSVHDCFVKYGHLSGGAVEFDNHGANCDMCVNIVLDAKSLLDKGKSLNEVRQFIVGKYGNIGPATDTPPVPL